MTALELTEYAKWKGPDFLHCPEAIWPDRTFDTPLREALTELKSTSWIPNTEYREYQEFNKLQRHSAIDQRRQNRDK